MTTLLRRDEKNQWIAGPAGQLEAIIPTATPPENTPLAIICHPHPLHGGTMHTKVVTTLAQAFKTLGAHVIRFNYRGVGQSAGSYGDGVGEIADTQAVITWAQQQWPERPLWLGGFSFGGYISLATAQKYPDLSLLVNIAPAVNHWNLKDLRVNCPWLVLIAEQDEIVPMTDIQQWLTTLSPPPLSGICAGANHLFDGKLLVLRDHLISHIRQLLHLPHVDTAIAKE